MMGSDFRLIFEGMLHVKQGKGEAYLRQARLFRDPRRKPCLRFYNVNDRTRLAPIFLCTFEAKTVVQIVPATPKERNTWISITTDGEEVLQCRAGDEEKTDVWKNALTAASVLAALLVSMQSTDTWAQTTKTATAAAGNTVILKSVYMLKAHDKNAFRPWIEIKRIPSSESRRSIVLSSGQRVREVFFEPKIELHKGDLVLVTDRSCPDIVGSGKYHMIKLRSPHNNGYVNAKLLQAAFLPESQAGLLRLLTPEVRKFLLHGTLSEVSSDRLLATNIRRSSSRQVKTPTPRKGKIFTFNSDGTIKSPSALSKSPSHALAKQSSAPAPSGSAALHPFAAAPRHPPLQIQRKRSLSSDDSKMAALRASKNFNASTPSISSSRLPAAAASSASASSRREVRSVQRPAASASAASKRNKNRSVGDLDLNRSRPRLKSQVRHQYLARIAIQTQLKNKIGLTAHGQKWLKTIIGQMDKFTNDHGPCQKQLYDALKRTPAERRQQGQLLDESGEPLTEEAIKSLLTNALAEMPDM